MTFGSRSLDAESLVLLGDLLLVRGVGDFVHLAAHAHHRQGEGAAVAGGRFVWVGAMDRHSVVRHRAAGLEMDLHLDRLILRAEIGDSLRKTEDGGERVGTEPSPV